MTASVNGCTCNEPDGPTVCDWCRGRYGRPTERPPFVHVTDDDVTEPRRVTPEQRRAVDLLELATPGCPLASLSRRDWKYVDRVVAGLARMGVPAAREPEPEENA